MPRDRAPQNSASSSQRRLFSDLQSVYQKIIQTSGPIFPLRSKDSRKSLHTAPTHSRNRQYLLSADSVFTSRVPSASSSVEEIVIKPLRFHDREILPSRSRRYSTSTTPSSITRSSTTPSSVSVVSGDVISGSSSCFLNRTDFSNQSDSRLARMRSKSGLAYNPIEYSEQSIRYVAEQVSLEQARQLKLRSNITQHRVDRGYFVGGSKVRMQNQAFSENQFPVQFTGDQTSEVGVPTEPKTLLTLKPQDRKKSIVINGTRLKVRTSHSPTLNGHSAVESADDVDEMSIPTVAIPTATVVKLDIVIATSDLSTDSADEKTTDGLSLSPT